MSTPPNSAPRRFGLSKSRISAFEQCPRRLWLQVHRRELGEYDDAQQQRIAAGHEVGEIACSLHPGGVMVEAEPDLASAVAATQKLIDDGHPGPIFEATFQYDGVLVRADVLSRDSDGGWRLAEVKSSTGPKDYHLGDLATQVWVMREAGVSLSGAAIRYINNKFILEQAGEYAGLFADAELLDIVSDVVAGRAKVVAKARRVLAGDEPVCEMGDHCSKPFACEFAGWCGRDAPAGPEWPVTILPRGGGRKWLEQGVEDLLDLKVKDLSPTHAAILMATRTGEPFHDTKGAIKAMSNWGWPRAWLDFETIAFAVPRWVGTRPYQQVPFQFSLHLEQEDGTITHHEFLDTSGADPRGPCAEALVRLIPKGATTIAYNAGFERSVMRDLAAACPKQAKSLLAMAEATVDLLPITRKHWYHRDQRGSWSIKAVLPTIGELDYAGMEVKDGGEAQAAYVEAIHPDTDAMRKQRLEEGLLAYCERDTWAMIAVARRLEGNREF